MAAFLHMAADYAKEIGFGGQLLIEPKPKEPAKHQYHFDAAAVIGFLKTYGLAGKFKLNIESNHSTLAGHSFAHELAVGHRRTVSWAASMPTGAIRFSAGTRINFLQTLTTPSAL